MASQAVRSFLLCLLSEYLGLMQIPNRSSVLSRANALPSDELAEVVSDLRAVARGADRTETVNRLLG